MKANFNAEHESHFQKCTLSKGLAVSQHAAMTKQLTGQHWMANRPLWPCQGT